MLWLVCLPWSDVGSWALLMVLIVGMLREFATLPHLLTVPQAAKVLGWSDRVYYERALRGEVPSVKLGGRRYVPKAQLMAWLGYDPNREVQADEHLPAAGVPGDHDTRQSA